MRQYRDGAAFCKAVIGRVGMDGLNQVWTSPKTLPTRAEIADPELWLARVHPEPAACSAHAAAMARRELGPAALAVAQAVDGALTDADTHLLVACSGGPDSLALAFAALRAATRDGRGLTRGGRRPRSAAGLGGRGRPGPGPARPAWASPSRGRDRDRGRPRPTADPRRPPAPPATPPCRARRPPGRPPSGSATPWTTRRRPCCSDWPAGSGLRSLAGMAARTGRLVRPLLGLRRSVTEQACAELGLDPWHDPHNDDPAVRPRTRPPRPCCPPSRPSSARGSPRRWPGRPPWPATTPTCSTRSAAEADPGTDTLDAASLLDLPAALRTRVIRRWLLRHGAAEVTAQHVAVGGRAGHPLARAGRNSPARCQSHPSGWESALPA